MHSWGTWYSRITSGRNSNRVFRTRLEKHKHVHAYHSR